MSVPSRIPLAIRPGWVVLALGGLLLAMSAGWAEQSDKSDPRQADLEKKLDRMLREIEDLRRELGRDKAPTPKPAEEVEKARSEVKKRAAEVEKVQEQLREATRQLEKAQDKLDELEGRRRSSSRGWGPWGRGDWGMGRGFGPPFPFPAPRPEPKDTDLEKRLEEVLKEIENLRRQLRR